MGKLTVQALRAVLVVVLAGTVFVQVGITLANLAVLKNGRAKAVRFATLAALCEVLGCQPGDLLRWEAEDAAADDLLGAEVASPGTTAP